MPNPIPDKVDEKVPLLMVLLATELISVRLSLGVLREGVMTTVMAIDPLNTPTTLTREMSVILKRAHRLLRKVVTALLLLKKELMSVEKWVVSWTDYVTYTVTRQSRAAVTTKDMVLLV